MSAALYPGTAVNFLSWHCVSALWDVETCFAGGKHSLTFSQCKNHLLLLTLSVSCNATNLAWKVDSGQVIFASLKDTLSVANWLTGLLYLMKLFEARMQLYIKHQYVQWHVYNEWGHQTS